MPRRRPHVCCETLEQKLQGLQEKDYEIKQALSRLSKRQTALRRRRRHLEQVALYVLCQSGGSHMLAQQFLERDLGEQGAQAEQLKTWGCGWSGVGFLRDESPGCKLGFRSQVDVSTTKMSLLIAMLQLGTVALQYFLSWSLVSPPRL